MMLALPAVCVLMLICPGHTPGLPAPALLADVLNWVGAQWTALLVAGCCLVVLSTLAFWWVARMDRLEARGCWHVSHIAAYLAASCGCSCCWRPPYAQAAAPCLLQRPPFRLPCTPTCTTNTTPQVYRLQDYRAMEDEEGGAGPPLPLPELPSLKHTSEDKDIALSASMTAKQQAAAARATKGSSAAAAAVDDDFSLRALVPAPAPPPPPSSTDVQLLSARSTPLPHSSVRALDGGSSSVPGDVGGSSSSATTPRGLPSVPPFSSFSSESWQISPARSRRGGWSQWNTPRGKGGA